MTKTKIITDGSVYQKNNNAISAYIIEDRGKEIDRGVEKFEAPRPSAAYGEFRAIALALEKAIQLEITDVALGCDSGHVVNSIRGEKEMQEFRGYISQIRKYINQFDSFDIFWVPRDEVEEAHNICVEHYDRWK